MSKTAVPLHADDHVLGGPDPFRPSLPYIWAHDDTIGQSVTATSELTFNAAKSNDLWSEDNPTGTFGLDPDDPEGLLIYRSGMYQVLADISYPGSQITVPRVIYSGWGRLSSGPLAALGSELRPAIGNGQRASGISEVTASATIAKSRLNHFALVLLQVFAGDTPLLTDDPFRLALYLQHNGSDYSTGSDLSSVTVVRLAGLGETIDFTP